MVGRGRRYRRRSLSMLVCLYWILSTRMEIQYVDLFVFRLTHTLTHIHMHSFIHINVIVYVYIYVSDECVLWSLAACR